MSLDRFTFSNASCKSIPFYKMHSIGNDFVIINISELQKICGILKLKNDEIRCISDRKYGIGCDQLLLFAVVNDKEQSTYVVDIYNNDGSIAYNCGNGLRCIMWLIHILSHGAITNITAVLANDRKLKLSIIEQNNDKKVTVGVEGLVLGQLGSYTIDKIYHYYGYDGYYINVGNEHFVTFVDNLEAIDVNVASAMYKPNMVFVNGINVSFVVVDTNDAVVRVYEKGAGETNACGSAAAAVYAAIQAKNGYNSRRSITFYQNNIAIIAGCEKDNSNVLYVIGPATLVGSGLLLC